MEVLGLVLSTEEVYRLVCISTLHLAKHGKVGEACMYE